MAWPWQMPIQKPNPVRLRYGNKLLQAPLLDMSKALMGTLENQSKMGIDLRKGMKNVVQANYETTWAFSRLAAVHGKNFAVKVKGKVLRISYKGSVDKTSKAELTTSRLYSVR
jgi:hypothetical protein